ncbi:MAG: glycosyltransferase family 4 protein [Flavobacteriales bacterium]|nr:glycosyltransferase family 4 protein [Flavobacteriales bacterium]
MKILQLCLKPPLPAKDGGCIAMNNITQGLIAAGHKVKILTIFTQKHDFLPEEIPQEYLDQTGIEGVYIDTRVNAVDAFSNFMTSDSYNISRFFSTDYDIKLTKILKKEHFDVIHLESLFMTPYVPTIRRYSHTPIVLRSHNLEFVIWEKIARGTKSFFKRKYLNYLTKKLRDYEISMLNEVSGIAAISEEDKKRILALGVQKKIRTIPFGIRMSDYPIDTTQKPEMALFHLGAMDWGPNLEGILWFLDKIWPKIHEKYPDLKMYLAGRNMSDEIRQAQHPNVIMVGEVENAISFMQSKAIMVVPLLSAGGIRVKIIEGLALGKAVISTTLGAEGLDCTDRKNIMLADRPDEWLKALDEIMEQPQLTNELGIQGRMHAEQHFDITEITSNLVNFYKELRKA